jgi:hypothetical protein
VKSFRRVVEGTAEVEEVFALLTSEKWAALLADHFRDDSRMVRREERADGGVTLEISRKVPSGVPGFLQKFLPSDPRIVTVDAWGPLVDGRRECTWTADIAGTPASLRGIQVLEPCAGGNRHIVEGSVKVSVPLVGGKAESFIADRCGHIADLEAELVQKLLEGS